ncbi:MAG: Cob(I)yrinic acid a,c-diamide adenosyltransferase [Microgenomates group bacterium GW2011_GWA1_46_15]|nr:MAG: Cob(I)yrinic acid a,c-diamide adenosyltransferase [Microgenomates group bacterium GW2011_GWB1_45_17]KKU23127.1 MAG: Cob(I)yrinic acid a,c-diamide adenosyltransferase [Microgenomates group bacterium GW2011_GWA1_46_15]KKU23790.1 MAG: Cob(I)yrinic acid a,c-diamide adenosyltransferase [Microgenomates group bacterium GW2011_GWC1_46_15]
MSGLIYIFTGDGKGKTSAALGMLLRALTNGWSVGWVSWYKEKRWGINEHHLSEILNTSAKKRLLFFPMGKGFYLRSVQQHGAVRTVRAQSSVIVDDDTPAQHRRAAHEALEKVRALLLQHIDVLFLDEVCNAVHDKLLKESDVLELLKQRGKTHVVLTGRNASAGLKKVADLVSVIQKEKHPFDAGKLAVKGLDF